MTNEMNVDGIRLAYVHLSVTTPRASGPRAAEATPVARGWSRLRWDRAAGSGPVDCISAVAG